MMYTITAECTRKNANITTKTVGFNTPTEKDAVTLAKKEFRRIFSRDYKITQIKKGW